MDPLQRQVQRYAKLEGSAQTHCTGQLTNGKTCRHADFGCNGSCDVRITTGLLLYSPKNSLYQHRLYTEATDLKLALNL